MSKNLHSQLQLISQVKEEAQDEQRIKSAWDTRARNGT